MARQETLTLFEESEKNTRKLSDEQFGKLMRAVYAYRFRGKVYDGDDPAVDMAFQFLSNQVDRGEEMKASNAKASNARWKKTNTDSESDSSEYIQNDANVCESMQMYANSCKYMQNDAPVQSYPILSNPIHKESKADKPPAPPKETRKPYGTFGWVKLADSEFNRLLNDLGEAEAKRCIAYVDESAQTTRNKNGWRDWNLVVRKCSKQGWGLDKASGGRNGKKDIPMGASGQLGQAELEAIQRVLAHPLDYDDGGQDEL